MVLTYIPSTGEAETEDHLCHKDSLPQNIMLKSQQFQHQAGNAP